MDMTPWPLYLLDLNLIEHVWNWMKRLMQEKYKWEHFGAQNFTQNRSRQIIFEDWNPCPDLHVDLGGVASRRSLIFLTVQNTNRVGRCNLFKNYHMYI